MNRDDIIKLAREAGIPIEIDWAGRTSTLVIKDGGTYLRGIDDLERFFQAAYAAGAKAERDALLADAERYRWLRRKDREFINDEMSNVGAVDSIMVCVFDNDCHAMSFFEGELDAAIDAAREEKP